MTIIILRARAIMFSVPVHLKLTNQMSTLMHHFLVRCENSKATALFITAQITLTAKYKARFVSY